MGRKEFDLKKLELVHGKDGSVIEEAVEGCILGCGFERVELGALGERTDWNRALMLFRRRFGDNKEGGGEEKEGGA